MPTKILVLGAGELGNDILKGLARKAASSTSITVLVRPTAISSTEPTKQSQMSTIKSLDISILPGDIANSSVAQLSSLFKPYDCIVSCLGFASGPGSQLKIARAVLDAGTKRYFPWQFGVDYDVIGRGSAQDLFDEQLDVRDLLRSQTTTEWVIVSTGMFTSFLFEQYFGVVELVGDEKEGEDVVRALGGWENKVTVTTPEDIGRLTAEIVLDEGIKNEVVFTAGETISYGRLADVVDEFVGRKVRREVWTVEELKQKRSRDPGNNVLKYQVVFAGGRGVSWDMERTYNHRKGIEVKDVRAWMQENLKGYGKGS